MNRSGLPQRRLIWSLAGAVLSLAGSIGTSGAQINSNATHRTTLPAGTVIPVQLNQTLNSKTSESGDKFTATVKYGQDDAGLPEGTRVEGVIREAVPSGDGKPGVLDVDFRRLVFPNGDAKTIEASLYSLDGKAVKRSDGRLIATADKSKDRLKWVGIGAGAGVLVGALTKGNTIVDTLLGAGAGYLFNELSNKKPGEVNLKQGAEFGLRLDRQLVFNMDDRSYYRRNGTGSDRNNDYRRGDDRYFNDDRKTNDDVFTNRRRNREDDFTNTRDNRDLESGDIGMLIDDREVRFDRNNRPYMRNNVVFIPIAAVGRTTNFDYRYSTDNKMIYARNNKVKLALDSRIATVNGERRRLPAAAEMKNGVVYVPMQFVGWALNGSSTWDAGSRTVVVTTDRERY